MTVSSQIIQVLDDLCRRFGIVIDWANESVLPYIEEIAAKFITYEVKTSWFWIFLALAIFVVAIGIGIILWIATRDPFYICLPLYDWTLYFISRCWITDP